MGAWSKDSKTRVATMGVDDFASNEKSVVIDSDKSISIRFVGEDGEVKVLKKPFKVLKDEVIDGTVMHVAALQDFLKAAVARAKEEGILFSAHLKATMMKVSDPIIFGHVVKAYFSELFDTYGDELAAAGLNPNNGLAAILGGLDELSDEVRAGVEKLIAKGLEEGPAVAMVDSDKGITNLHVPSDVIVDASMPAMIRVGGKMWDAKGNTADTLAVIPDSSYAGVYQTVIEDCQANGAFDPTTMGTVPNVGLMAQKAEEYGSHDKTFELAADGHVQIVDENNTVLIEHQVFTGDIWRACQTKDVAIRDWVKLAVNRARASQTPIVFWLDENRAHDAVLIAKVKVLDRPHPRGQGHHLGDRQRPARLPDRPVPDHGTGHLGQDALHRSADGGRRHVRNRRRRLGTQARPATGGRELPALGLPGRVHGTGRFLRAPGSHHRQRPRTGSGRHPGCRHRHLPAGRQVAVAQGRRARQPRQPLLRTENIKRLPMSTVQMIRPILPHTLLIIYIYIYIYIYKTLYYLY